MAAIEDVEIGAALQAGKTAAKMPSLACLYAGNDILLSFPHHPTGIHMTQTNARVADHPAHPQFLSRWSPRAYANDEISEQELLTILEAARWAPSSYNSQPWRFVFARRGTPHWNSLLGLLNEFNRSWAQNASVLIIVLSKTTFAPPGSSEELPAPTHSFDTGAAWGYLALQASLSGWHAHAMAGF